MGDANDAVIKKTQDMLTKIIKKPPLTDKLLGRPPFRFLHDIMTSIIRATGFMKGLFTEEEMNSENIKEKEQKISFLQKVIDIVVAATGKKLSVKPSKVVAGVEADKTNELLQAIAEAVSKSGSNDELVKQVLSGESKPASTNSSKAKERERETSADRNNKKDSSKEQHKPDKEQPAAKDKDSRRSSSGKDGQTATSGATASETKAAPPPPAPAKEEKKEEKRESSRQPRSTEIREERSGGDEKRQGEASQDRPEREDKRKEKQKDIDRERGKEVERQDERQLAVDVDVSDKALVNGSKDDEEPPANRIPRPSSAKGSRRRYREEDDRNPADRLEKDGGSADTTVEIDGGEVVGGGAPLSGTSTEPRRLVRPSSARPAPPRVRKQDGVGGGAAMGSEPNGIQERVDSGKKVANLITENGGQSDDDETFVIQDGLQETGEVDRARDATAPSGQYTGTDDGEHGGLVKKILETRKEFEGKQNSSSASGRGEPGVGITEAAQRKEREIIQREVEKLRSSIQTLTRSANPLGKVMDYVQEDVDAMHKELLSWKKENRELALQLRREQSVTESSVEPLRAQLEELEQSIADRLDLIAAVKHNIARNDEKIDKMLSTVAKT